MITIEKESFNDGLLRELLPLAQKCWNERTIEKGETCAFHGARDIEIEPDVERYKDLAKAGALAVITVRDEGLKGYVLGVIHTSMHHKPALCAFVDCLYMEPEYRSYAGPAAERFEKEMKDRGVQIIGWPVHTNGPLYELAKAMKYTGDDTVMEKRI